MAGRIDGVSLGLVAAGGLFAYAGLKGYSVPHALQALVRGQAPTVKANPIAGTSSPGAAAAGEPGTPAGPSSSHGASYTHAQLVQLWEHWGGDPGAANNAACHAIQESGGDPAVTSRNPDGGVNVGLWQLDTKGKGAGYTVQQLQNADLNAQLTIMATSNGTDWSAWATPGC